MADVILNGLVKYGVKDYTTKGSSVTTTQSIKQGNNHNTITTKTNTLEVNKVYGTTLGIGLQSISNDSGICFGTGYYFDETLEMSVGWKF